MKRRELLRDYLIALLATGEQPVTLFSQDLAAALKEISSKVDHRLGDIVKQKLKTILSGVFDNGVTNAWDLLQNLYARGVDAAAKRGNHGND